MTWKAYSWKALVAVTILAPISIQLSAQSAEKIQPHKPGANLVYIAGAVNKPGGYALEEGRKITILQALSVAEGLTLTARPGSALIIRRTASGSRFRIPADINKMLKGRVRDIEMIEGDILYVPNVREKGDPTGPLGPARLLSLKLDPTPAKGKVATPDPPGHLMMCTTRLRP
jgi:hypothetical protein